MKATRGIAASTLLLLATTAAPAQAADPAAAQALFNEGKKALARGDYASACPKFEESQKLDPGVGTQFNLADCYERSGRTASAWGLFLEVAAETKSQPAREKLARDRAAVLEPKLTRLVVAVPSAAKTPSIEVKRDGTPIGRAEWGTAIPVDPGAHVVSASASGFKPWESTVKTQGEGQTATVTVPPLEAETTTAPEPAPAPETASPEPSQAPPEKSGGPSPAVFALGGLGIAGLAVGGTFGVLSLMKHNDASSHCTGNTCDATGVSLRDDAIHAGNISTIAFAVGAAGVGAAAILWLTTSPSSSKPSRGAVQASPLVGTNAGGLSVRGSW